jgi:hypothetical protein
LYACLDDQHLTPSSTAITDERVWNTDLSKKVWKLYLAGRDESALSPYAAPSRAHDLTNLPSTYLTVGEADLLRDENIEYTTRLMQAGILTELHVYPGAFHGFDGAVPTAQVSQRGVSEYVTVLKRGLSSHEPRLHHVSDLQRYLYLIKNAGLVPMCVRCSLESFRGQRTHNKGTTSVFMS